MYIFDRTIQSSWERRAISQWPTVLSMGIVWFLLLVGEVSNMMDRDRYIMQRKPGTLEQSYCSLFCPMDGEKATAQPFTQGVHTCFLSMGTFHLFFPFLFSPAYLPLKKHSVYILTELIL